MELADAYRRFTAGTHAIIDLDAYQRNLRALRARAPRSSALMAVVKADAYGHGAVQCALAAESLVDWFGVARIQEALVLRARGIRLPILVMGPPNVEELELAIVHDITLSVGTIEHVAAIITAARSCGRTSQLHLKIDTGMHRYGFHPKDALAASQYISHQAELSLNGAYTHFATADESDQLPTKLQIHAFEEVLRVLRSHEIAPRFVHCANSAAILTGMTGTTNMVRAGIATYGISPSDEVPVPNEFQQILSVKTRISRVFELEAGDGVSYGLSYRAEKREHVAATAAGYADGLPRQLSNTGWFSAEGNLMPIRGRVCMDQTVISTNRKAASGDAVCIIGDGSLGEMTLDDVARIAGTNSYEIATRVTARVPRVYVRDRDVVAIEHLLLGEAYA